MPVSCKRRAQADVTQARGDMEAAQACRLPHGGLLVLRYLAPGLPWAQLEVLLDVAACNPCYAHGPWARMHQRRSAHLQAFASLSLYAARSWELAFTGLAASRMGRQV